MLLTTVLSKEVVRPAELVRVTVAVELVTLTA